MMMSSLAQTLDNCMQIEVEALGHRKKPVNRLSRRAPLDTFINFYHGIKLMAELLRNLKGSYYLKGLWSAG